MLQAAIKLANFWAPQANPNRLAQARAFHTSQSLEAYKMAPAHNNADDSRFLLHMLGCPGSGKTSIANLLACHLRAERPEYKFYFLDFDQVMESLPGYQLDVAHNPAHAYENWVLPARVAGYELLNRLFAERINILFDHGGSDIRHAEILQEACGPYKVGVAYIKVPLETAQSRVAQRQSQPGARVIPPGIITERFQAIETAAAGIYPQVSRISVLNNTTPPTPAQVNQLFTELQI